MPPRKRKQTDKPKERTTTRRRPKGEDVEGSIRRMVEGNPEEGRRGLRNPDHRRVVEDYLRVRKNVDRVAVTTRRNDVQAALTLSRFLDEERCGKVFEDVNSDDLMEWREAIERLPYNLSEATASVYALYLKRFFKFVAQPNDYRRGKVRQKAIPYPEAVEWIAAPSGSKRRLPVDSILSSEDVRRLVAACPTPRDRALIMTLWDSGFRLNELLNLRVRNFETTGRGRGRLILPVDGTEMKTGARSVPVFEAVPTLVVFLNSHPFRDHPDAPLFYTENASDYGRAVRAMEAGDEEEAFAVLRLTRAGLRGVLDRIVKHSGVRKRVTPHTFRHSRATFFAAKSVTEAALRARFG